MDLIYLVTDEKVQNLLAETGSASTADSAWKLAGILILCVIIIVASYYTTKWVGKNQQKKTAGSNFELIDAMRLTQNKTLQLVRAGKKYLLLAVTKENVTLLCEMNEDDIEEPKVKEAASFGKVLSGIVHKKSSEGKETKISQIADASFETENKNVEESDVKCDNDTEGSGEPEKDEEIIH